MTYRDALRPGGFSRLNALLQPKGPLPFSKSTVWQWVRDGYFPPPVRLGPRLVAWKNDSVIAFLQMREKL